MYLFFCELLSMIHYFPAIQLIGDLNGKIMRKNLKFKDQNKQNEKFQLSSHNFRPGQLHSHYLHQSSKKILNFTKFSNKIFDEFVFFLIFRNF